MVDRDRVAAFHADQRSAVEVNGSVHGAVVALVLSDCTIDGEVLGRDVGGGGVHRQGVVVRVGTGEAEATSRANGLAVANVLVVELGGCTGEVAADRVT